MNLTQKFKKLEDLDSYCKENGLNILDILIKATPYRAPTFKKAIDFLNKVKPNTLIETGTARGRFDINLPSIVGDGASTVIFALWCRENNAKIYTVDINKTCIDNCRLNINALGLSEYVEFVISDSIKFLEEVNEKDIKFLYLDSYDFDYNDPLPSQMHHLKEYLAVKNKLSSNCGILIDDCGLPHGGKGLLLEKELVKDNYKLVLNGYQHMYLKI